MEAGGAVLVTGGAGYIGSHTVRALRAAGREVVVLDSLELGTAAAVVDARLVGGDSADGELVGSVLREKSCEPGATTRSGVTADAGVYDSRGHLLALKPCLE